VTFLKKNPVTVLFFSTFPPTL